MSSRTTAPRTGGKTAPKGYSPPRDAAASESADKPEDATATAAADTLRHRRRSTDPGSGSGGDATGNSTPSHWQTLRDLMEHKALLQTLLRGSKAWHTNAADAARQELSVPKRALLHAAAYGLRVPAGLADQPLAMKAVAAADHGIGWVYDRARNTVPRLVAEGERMALEGTKRFDAVINATPAKADITPVVSASAAENNGKAQGIGGGVSGVVMRVVAVMVYLTVALARGALHAVCNPRDAYDAIKAGGANVFSAEQWKLRATALVNASRRVWAALRASNAKADAEPGNARSAALEWIGTAVLCLMPWRAMPQPRAVQYAH